jgi:hypothetical protein
VGAAVLFTSLKGQWCKIFYLSFLHQTLPWGGPKEDSFEQIFILKILTTALK